MRTLKLTVEYDGTDFCGYQHQGKGERTVQDALGVAIQQLAQQDVKLQAAGRTDTGVHALGQVISFETDATLSTERWAIALNSLLPPDIAVARAEEAAEGFHARFSAKSRTYIYLAWTRRSRSALYGRYSLHLRRPVDIDQMRDAARSLTGTHDFAAFARASSYAGPSTVRDLQHLTVRRLSQFPLAGGGVSDLLLFKLTASGFLRTMVRNIVGALLEVGVGDLPSAAIAEILATRDRAQNPCVPVAPQGLCLLRVQY